MKKIRLEVKDKALRPLKRARTLTLSPKRIVLIIFILFLLLVIGYFYRQINFLIRPPHLEVSQPPADITVKQSIFEIAGRTDPSAYLTVNDKKVYIDKQGNFQAEIELSQGVNVISIQAKNRFDKINEIIRRIIYEI
jgi:hypothetical protein